MYENEGKTPQNTRFEFLDGYRGLLALIVICAHAKDDYKCVFLDMVGNCTQKFAITGFFVLSSFLLTYRLIKELDKPNVSKLLPIIQYFIRRFFRIYIPYVLFAIAAKFGPPIISGFTYGNYDGSLTNLLSLGHTGLNHLWTIPPEIKFYFFIPLICLIFVWLNNMAPIFLAACLVWTWYDQIFNYFNLKVEYIYSYSKHSNLLRNHFAVFLVGSEVAMALKLTERCEPLMKLLKSNRMKFILNVTSVVIGLFGLVYHTENLNFVIDYRYRSRPAIIWGSVLFLAILNDPSNSWLSKFLAYSSILKSCGKFSFGMYLLHPGAINFVKSFLLIVEIKLGFVLSNLLSFILGLAFYHLLEKHLIHFANFLCIKISLIRIFINQTNQLDS